MQSLGFDPSAQVEYGGGQMLVEAVMDRAHDGRILLTLLEDDGSVLISLALRPDFLDEFVAQARAREAAA